MQCKREGCDKELVNPRAMFCGDACRMAHARSAKKSPEHNRVASLEDYKAHPDDYAWRACAELLNWGSWMSVEELKFSSFSANRQVVPGDWDYKEGS